MIRLILALVAIVAFAASPALAQCNSATGQCGAPSAASLPASAQLLQAQLDAGLAQSSASTAVSAPAFAPAPQIVYQRAPAFAYGAVAAANPAQVYVAIPAPSASVPAVANSEVNSLVPTQQLFQLAAFQAPAVAAGGASAAASASAGVPFGAVAPVPVQVPLASAAVGGCASGNCSARARIGSRLAARLARPRSTATTLSFSHSRIR